MGGLGGRSVTWRRGYLVLLVVLRLPARAGFASPDLVLPADGATRLVRDALNLGRGNGPARTPGRGSGGEIEQVAICHATVNVLKCCRVQFWALFS